MEANFRVALTPAFAAGLGLLLSAHPALADWAGFAGYAAVAEIAIEGRAIHLNLRVLDSALPRLASLAAPREPQPSWERLAGQLARIEDKAGKPLPGQPAGAPKANPADGSAEPFHEADFDYALPEGAATLAIAPPAGVADRDIGLIALHRGVPVGDLAPLTRPLTLRLDPNDPWRSRFDDPARARRHAEPRSYVYIEPYEVRHEMLLRLRDLRPWLSLDAENPGLEPGTKPDLKRKIGALLANRNPLLIDGVAAAPQIDRVEFVRFSREGVRPVDDAERLDANGALVGVMLSYLTEKPAERIVLAWNLFGGELQRRAVSVIQGRESFEGDMGPKQPAFEWSREEALDPAPPAETEADRPSPAARPDATITAEILQALLHNAYRAFALRGEEAAYDRLAKSLDGELLEDIYLQQRLALLRQADGLGGEGRVDRIEILESKLVDSPQTSDGQAVDARWIAHGTVSHWGHSHGRHNLYAARLVLRRSAGGWKIAAMDFQGGQRLEAGAPS